VLVAAGEAEEQDEKLGMRMLLWLRGRRSAATGARSADSESGKRGSYHGERRSVEILLN
jgi:hypothetical protein